MAGAGDPQTAGTPGDHRARVAELARPCDNPVECGHSGYAHHLTEAGKRARCTVATAGGGWCPCTEYTPPSNPVANL